MIVCIVDTSVLCELLAVPGKSQRHDEAVAEFAGKQKEGHRFLLPLSAVIETGNHIAHVSDGTLRRNTAERFVALVRKSIDGELPFTPTPAPTASDVKRWLDHFVDDAMRQVGLADRSIIALWKSTRRTHEHGRVYIWSYDAHLSGYDTG